MRLLKYHGIHITIIIKTFETKFPPSLWIESGNVGFHKWKKTRNNFLFFVSTSSFIFLSEFPHPMWSLLTPCMSYNVWGLDELRPIFPQPSNGPGSIFCHSLSDLISRASVEMNLLCTAAFSVQPHFFLSTRLQQHISQVIEIRI